MTGDAVNLTRMSAVEAAIGRHSGTGGFAGYGESLS